jgi:bifunctional non-homologous end joining protein LigD
MPRPLPVFVNPQLAHLAEKVPLGDAWVYAPRCIAAASGPEVRCYTRSGLDWTSRFGAVPAALAGLNLEGALIDGEIVVLDEHGRSDFDALRASADRAVLYAFDLLAHQGRDLRALPLLDRKVRLRELLVKAPKGAPLLYAAHMADGVKLYETVCRLRLEGIVAKRADQPYRSGPGRDCLKVKCPD